MDSNILFFFILPLAVIIFSIAFQRLLNSPVLISAIVFITFLIIAFFVTDLTVTLIIAAIAFAIVSFITSFVYCVISNFLDRVCRQNNNDLNSCTSRLCCKRRLCNTHKNN